MRLVVTGRNGQVARALVERGAARGVEIVALGRPELDLERPATLAPALAAARPDAIVNAAAHTAVDAAESEEAQATLINGEAAGIIAAAAAEIGAPVIQFSSDYVFDGRLERPYREDDPVDPVSAYGRSKLAGEQAVAAATDNHAILRTAWVYSPFGRNFVRTMLRLGETRDEIAVVTDQLGCPTSALDIADAVIGVARNLLAPSAVPALRGIFHIAGQGETSWAGLAEALFADAAALGRRPVSIRPIPAAAYPTPAQRPANSRLDCEKLAAVHGIRLPHWRDSLKICVERLIAAERTS